MTTHEAVDPTEVFKALSDPMRWKIVQELAAEEGEYACSLLEETVPVSKPTISYHTKLLAQAGLIETRKRGRKYYYVLRRDVLHEMADVLWNLTPGPRVADESGPSVVREVPAAQSRAVASGETDTGAMLMTW
ncbi:metalloregulator ArsR/SmtB family transcription factor [Streptomyces sp. NPDC052052]|uniref:ArsR/SmtB family transcription factor n=1 Tax=Streptomyces sp. NPDC052052 TaxID=3154756 RepID=UPI00343C071A